jgi:hypothetical protein
LNVDYTPQIVEATVAELFLRFANYRPRLGELVVPNELLDLQDCLLLRMCELLRRRNIAKGGKNKR